MAYGDSLAAESRLDGDVPVYGSNGRVGAHDLANTLAPVIVVGRKGSHGRLQFSESAVFAIDTTYFVDRRGTSCNLRWLFYALSVLGLDQLSYDVGVPGLSRELAYEQRVPLPEAVVQQGIADFLDTEAARIDGLIDKKQRMLALLDRRLRTIAADLVFTRSTSSWVRIGRVIDLLPGFAFSSEDFIGCDHGGIRLLRGVNVTPGKVRWSDVACLDAAAASSYQRYELSPGDLVLGMDRPFVLSGMRIATVSDTDTPCLLVQRVVRIRPLPSMNADFVRAALASEAFVAYFEPILTGVSVPHISPDQISDFRIPWPARWQQDKIAAELSHAERRQEALRKRLDRQIALLKERRQALITAAVTGELDVTMGAA